MPTVYTCLHPSRRLDYDGDVEVITRWTAAGKRMCVSSDELEQSIETKVLSVLTAAECGKLNGIVDKLVDEFRKSGKEHP